MKTDDPTEKEKRKIEFKAVTNAWYKANFEMDKFLLTISSGGIGLLVTLITTTEILTNCIVMIYILAIISFSLCIICVITMYPLSCNYITKVLSGNESNDPVIGLLNKVARTLFIFGIIFTFLIGLLSIID